MKIVEIMNETLNANNGELSRGLKNQLTILPAMMDNDSEAKLEILKELNIFNYIGLRSLEFSYGVIKNTIDQNSEKIEIYKSNPIELIRDLRREEMNVFGSNLDADFIGGTR